MTGPDDRSNLSKKKMGKLEKKLKDFELNTNEFNSAYAYNHIQIALFVC